MSRNTTIKQVSWMTSDFEPGLVSIIVPTYNRAMFLPELVKNIQAQEYRPIEIIIVDDGSTDATSSIIKDDSFIRQCNNKFQIRYFRRKKGGVGSARNSGLYHSRGEFIQFLDSDDRLLPQKFSIQFKYLRDHPDIDYVYSKTVQIGSAGQPNGTIGKPMDETKIAMNIALHLWHTSGPLYRRSVCKKTGPWDETMMISEDWEYAARIKAVSQKGAYLPDLLSEYVIHSGDQLVKDVSKGKINSRNKAIQNVIGLIQTVGDPEKCGLDICARALVANGITAGVQGDARFMQRNMSMARSIGQFRTQCMAVLLYGMNFFIPIKLLDWTLRMARRYGAK